MSTSDVHRVLRKRIYTGDFDWKGKRYAGRHQPLVTQELWDRVQDVLDGRYASKVLTRTKRNFAFTGVITCGHCGCSVVGEMKKGKYVYYHCTGWKGKCSGPYVREEVLQDRFSELLGRLSFSDEIVAWLTQALHESHSDEEREHVEAIARLQTEYERLRRRVQAVYMDKLDGRVDAAFYDQITETMRADQDRCLSEIKWHQNAERSYMEDGIALLELAGKAQRLFVSADPDRKRRLLNFVLSNCVWKDGELSAEFKHPFDMLVEAGGWEPPTNDPQGGENTDSGKWRRERDCTSLNKTLIYSTCYERRAVRLCTTEAFLCPIPRGPNSIRIYETRGRPSFQLEQQGHRWRLGNRQTIWVGAN
ncbi:MAG: recombinase zinc beta ribbon domain-containing protein [Devosia sp.]|nr:recombinase zinc beta ribbon domain-containing protein [Devosia sp.]